MILKPFVFALVFALPIQSSFASIQAKDLSHQIQIALNEKFPQAEIRLPNLEQLASSDEIASLGEIEQTRIIEERGNGVVVIDLFSKTGKTVRIQTPYQALVKVPVALKRIFPNSKVKKEDYRIAVINIAISPAKEYRGLMIMNEEKLENTETRQTILEGQFFVSSSIQKTPDLRKGETVKLLMNSGDLSLSTAATILESASIGENVRVMTFSTGETNPAVNPGAGGATIIVTPPSNPPGR